MTVTFNIRTEEATRDQIDEIAEALHRNRDWVINEAIENYLALHRWQIEKVQLGLDEMKAGLGVPHEEVFARLECRRRGRDNQSGRDL